MSDERLTSAEIEAAYFRSVWRGIVWASRHPLTMLAYAALAILLLWGPAALQAMIYLEKIRDGL